MDEVRLININLVSAKICYNVQLEVYLFVDAAALIGCSL